MEEAKAKRPSLEKASTAEESKSGEASSERCDRKYDEDASTVEGEDFEKALKEKGEAVTRVTALEKCTPEECETAAGCDCKACGVCLRPGECQCHFEAKCKEEGSPINEIEIEIEKGLKELEEVKDEKADKGKLVEGLRQLAEAQMEKIDGVFDKLKKHLPEDELKSPKEKAFSCLRDLLNWVRGRHAFVLTSLTLMTLKVTTALKRSAGKEEGENKHKTKALSQASKEELHVRRPLITRCANVCLLERVVPSRGRGSGALRPPGPVPASARARARQGEVRLQALPLPRGGGRVPEIRRRLRRGLRVRAGGR